MSSRLLGLTIDMKEGVRPLVKASKACPVLVPDGLSALTFFIQNEADDAKVLKN